MDPYFSGYTGNELVLGDSNLRSPGPTQHDYSSYPYNDGSSESTPSNYESEDDSDYDILNSGVRTIENRIRRRRQKLPMWPVGLPGADYIEQVINMENETNCEWQFRMGQEAFDLLARKLVDEGGYVATRGVPVEEALGMFLKVVGHSHTNRAISDRHCHSLQTINRDVHKVLNAVVNLSAQLIRPRHTDGVAHRHIEGNPKYDPWFRNCIGAIDGTHVGVDGVPKDVQHLFRNRKGLLTQNVLCVCDFDMLFTFVYTGWERSAHDNRILQDVIFRSDLDFPIPSPGQFYVVDSAYTCKDGFLPPYRGERYHLSAFRGTQSARGPRELFNKYHSSLRNVIERTFAVLKGRFKILKKMTNYELADQALLVMACCVIHNFIRLYDTTDELFTQYENPDRVPSRRNRSNDAGDTEPEIGDMETPQMHAMRDEMAAMMWAARQRT